MSFKDYLKQPEITLHLENIATYEDGKGDRVTWQDGKRIGPGPKDTILKGPMDFTFTLGQPILPIHYQGAVPLTVDGIPFRLTEFAISVFDIDAAYEVLAPVNPIHVTRPDEPEPEPDPDKLASEDVSKAIYKILEGLWTEDGTYVDFSGQSASSSMGTSQDGTCDGNVGINYPHPIDPAAVTAVDIAGTRVELSELTRLDG